MQVKKIKGVKINTPAGVGAESTDFVITEADGAVIGVAVGENYNRADLGAMNLTIEADGVRQVQNLPLTNLLPDGERFYLPLPSPLVVGQRVTLTLESASAQAAAANPVTAVLYHAKS